MITPEELSIKLQNFAKCIGKDTSILIPPLEGARAEMLYRIHNEGKATDGTLIGVPKVAAPPHIGAYSQRHGRRRAKRGRQNKIKDLQLEGDLIRSVTTGETGGVPSVGFDTSEQREIAEHQEAQTEKRIWGLTKGERATFEKQLEKILSKDLKDCYDKS